MTNVLKLRDRVRTPDGYHATVVGLDIGEFDLIRVRRDLSSIRPYAWYRYDDLTRLS